MSVIVRLLARQPLGDLGDVRRPIKPNGMTLLHVAARLYAIARQRDDFAGAKYYDDATRRLLEAGADPLALMRDAHSMTEHTPASACSGYTPPSLRARMQDEAAAGRVGDTDSSRRTPWSEPYADWKARRAARR